MAPPPSVREVTGRVVVGPVEPTSGLRRPAAVVAVITLVAVAHVAWVAGRYHVGSFDDDGAYLYMAKSIVAGAGLTGHLPDGLALVNVYPPGYAYLLAPLVWVFGPANAWLPERLLSVICVAAVFPLTWIYLRRRGLSEFTCSAVLVLLALNPVLATYGSMVMAEAPFLVVFLLLLMAADRWTTSRHPISWSGLSTVVLAAGAVWLKEAAVAMVAAVVVWLLWRRDGRRAALAAAGCVALLGPIVVARMLTGTPIAGSRYSGEIGAYFGGDLLHRLVIVVPEGIGKFLFDALPSAVVPSDSPVSDHLGVFIVFRALACASVFILCIAGAVIWARRWRLDAAFFLILFYTTECVAYRYVVERRVILILPVVVAWYVIGAQAFARRVLAVARRRHWSTPTAWRRGLVAAACIGVLGPLFVQLPTDYRLRLGQATSSPGGSSYMEMLARLGHRSEVVETDYLWTTALDTGHATAPAAFNHTVGQCRESTARDSLEADHAAYLYTAAIDSPTHLNSPCLLALASGAPWAVRLLHTARDDATVFELIGPGTPHPALRDLVSVASAKTPLAGSASMAWALPAGAQPTQVSVGAAGGPVGALRGAVTKVVVRLREGGGAWHTVASADGAVGDGGAVPFLLATVAPGTRASALQVTIVATRSATGTATVDDVHVLGTAPTDPAPPHPL